MRFFYKFLASFLCVTMLIGGMGVANAEQIGSIATENPEVNVNEPMDAESAPVSSAADLQITSKSAILLEQTTGKIIYEHNSHEKLSPASVTKIMSLLLIMEAIERGDITLETMVTTSPHAAGKGGSQIWLKEGEQMSVNDLLKATVIASANDATTALAEAVAGSEETFVGMMNDRARQLGMNDTTFMNCTGLDAEGHLTSAYDIAIMSKELLAHELITKYSTVWMDTLRDGKSELVNTNKLVRFYEGTTGLKTGTTSKAGYCLSASATRDNLSLIAVVMDSPSSKVRFNEARELLSFGFANFASVKVELPEKPRDVRVVGGMCDNVSVGYEGEANVILEKIKKDTLTTEIILPDSLNAPIEKGQQIGECIIKSEDKEVARVKIVAEGTVHKMTFGKAFLTLLKQMAVI